MKKKKTKPTETVLYWPTKESIKEFVEMSDLIARHALETLKRYMPEAEPKLIRKKKGQK